jgi:hypothetical protein
VGAAYLPVIMAQPDIIMIREGCASASIAHPELKL